MDRWTGQQVADLSRLASDQRSEIGGISAVHARWIPHVKILALAFALTFYVGAVRLAQGHKMDFLAQWTLAHLATTLPGPAIYSPSEQERVLRESLDPSELELDRWFLKGVGISPYPPVMVLLYAPLGLLSPGAAQSTMVLLSILLAGCSAWWISEAVDRRVGFLTAFLAILYFPGFFYTVALGQNALVTLAMWSFGLWQLTRRRDISAGFAWGLLVYKLHWLVAVLWIPVVFRRWRVLAGIAASVALTTIAATAAFSPDIWQHWFDRIQAFSDLYARRTHQLGMGCDLRALLYRYLPNEWAAPCGWLALGTLVAVGTGTYLAVPPPRVDDGARPTVGVDPRACPLWWSAGLVIPYLMYYDTTLFLLPLLVTWSTARAMSRWQVGVLSLLTAGFYVALPIMDSAAPRWSGFPWITAILLAMWSLSLVHAVLGTARWSASSRGRWDVCDGAGI